MKLMKFYIKTSKSEHFCSKCCCMSETRFLQPNSNLPRHNSKQNAKRSYFNFAITETSHLRQRYPKKLKMTLPLGVRVLPSNGPFFPGLFCPFFSFAIESYINGFN